MTIFLKFDNVYYNIVRTQIYLISLSPMFTLPCIGQYNPTGNVFDDIFNAWHVLRNNLIISL